MNKYYTIALERHLSKEQKKQLNVKKIKKELGLKKRLFSIENKVIIAFWILSILVSWLFMYIFTS